MIDISHSMILYGEDRITLHSLKDGAIYLRFSVQLLRRSAANSSTCSRYLDESRNRLFLGVVQVSVRSSSVLVFTLRGGGDETKEKRGGVEFYY